MSETKKIDLEKTSDLELVNLYWTARHLLAHASRTRRDVFTAIGNLDEIVAVARKRGLDVLAGH